MALDCEARERGLCFASDLLLYRKPASFRLTYSDGDVSVPQLISSIGQFLFDPRNSRRYVPEYPGNGMVHFRGSDYACRLSFVADYDTGQPYRFAHAHVAYLLTNDIESCPPRTCRLQYEVFVRRCGFRPEPLIFRFCGVRVLLSATADRAAPSGAKACPELSRLVLPCGRPAGPPVRRFPSGVLESPAEWPFLSLQ